MTIPGIGSMLRDARAQKNFTLTEAARELQINKSTLSRLENHPGYALSMSPLKLIQICNLYQRSFVGILSGKGLRSSFCPGGVIVLVDDEKTQLMIYQALLKRHFPGQLFHGFYDSEKALRWLRNNRARMVLTDYRMPALDGGRLLMKLASTENRYTPAILMTDKTEVEIIREVAKRQNAVFYYKRQRKFALIRLVRDILSLA